MPMPIMTKTISLAPVAADAEILHDMACAYVNEQFILKGEVKPTWIIASGYNVAFIETEFDDADRSKDIAAYIIRETLKRYGCQAYSFISEVWSAAFKSDEEHQQWKDAGFTDVASLPPHMRDDMVMILSHDREGEHFMSKYLVTIRPPGRGLNFLGPRMDENYVSMAGRISNLFEPQVPIDEAIKKEKKK